MKCKWNVCCDVCLNIYHVVLYRFECESWTTRTFAMRAAVVNPPIPDPITIASRSEGI